MNKIIARLMTVAFVFLAVNTTFADWHTMKKDQLMAVSEKVYDRAFSMMMDQDNEAASQARPGRSDSS
jgi:hypothetical protein